MEVPYECPPEDESAVGVPEHLMIRNLNGNKTMDKDEYMRIVDGIYQQYTRPEYFSAEYLQYAQEYYKDSLNIVERNIPINEKKAKKYRQNYLDIVDKIRIKLQNKLNQSDGSLFMKSRNQRQLEEQAGGPDNLVDKVA